MTEKFGPSNWTKQPNETRRGEDAKPSSPKNDGEKTATVWTPRNLMEERAQRALENNDLTPDAMIGLDLHLSSIINSGSDSEYKRAVLNNEALIKRACEVYVTIPPSTLTGSPHAGDRVQKTADNPQALVEFVAHHVEMLKDTSLSDAGVEVDRDEYAIGCLSDILNITAIFLDKQEKSSLK